MSVADELIENVNTAFTNNCIKDTSLRGLTSKLEQGTAIYEDAYKYADSIGSARAKAFQSQISSEVLPGGGFDYETASSLMRDSLGADFDMVSEYAQGVQELVNGRNDINLKALQADENIDRIEGFVKRLASEAVYDDVKWLLDEPIVTHAQSVVDDTIKKNAEFQYKAGLEAKVTRHAAPRCCDWCNDIEGDYTYPGVDGRVFQRHDRCKCTVDYNGRKLTAYNSGKNSHSFRDQGEQDQIEGRKKISDSAVNRFSNSNENGIINSYQATERAKSRKMHADKYGDNAILVNEKYISTDEYYNKFIGITGNKDVDASICEISRGILKDRTGTKKETLVVLDKSNGNPILTIKGTEDGGISYSIEHEKVIADAKKDGVSLIAIHNHPTGYPPTADDCVSALLRGYDTGITCGHNGTVHTYYPSKDYYTVEECNEIHSIIIEECEYKTNIEHVLKIWKDTLSEFGMTIKDRG